MVQCDINHVPIFKPIMLSNTFHSFTHKNVASSGIMCRPSLPPNPEQHETFWAAHWLSLSLFFGGESFSFNISLTCMCKSSSQLNSSTVQFGAVSLAGYAGDEAYQKLRAALHRQAIPLAPGMASIAPQSPTEVPGALTLRLLLPKASEAVP